MENLIKALSIFLKYGNVSYPTHCEHDVLYVVGDEYLKISKEDKKELKQLGFLFDKNEEHWYSYRYGSC